MFRLRRPWLNESLLEQYRRDWSFLIDVGWLFDGDGPLSRIPIAVVVARDILYRVSFNTDGGFEHAHTALEKGRSLRLSVGTSTLIVEPGAARLNARDRTLTIAPASSRAQIIAVISIRY